MGESVSGRNPYIQDADIAAPTKPYVLKVIDPDKHEHVIQVDPAKLPAHTVGQPGSILDLALAAGIEVDHACGGVCACSTCHVIVRSGLESCNEAGDEEEDQLDEAYGLTPQSRLACQCVPNGSQPVLVEIPAWNRNLAREPAH
jgi:2Fe-2S ferredoxin